MLDIFISILIAIPAFAVLLGLIVFIHEYGHFKTARLCGVKIETFSLGFGPALLQRTDRHGTVWKIAAIPLGGFVKFFGDANAASAGAESGEAGPATTQFTSEKDRLESLLTPEEKAVCFHFKPVWQRMLIVAAGPLANFILALVIFIGILYEPWRAPCGSRGGVCDPGQSRRDGGICPWGSDFDRCWVAGSRPLTISGPRSFWRLGMICP